VTRVAAAEGSSGPAARAEDRVERAMRTAVGVGIGIKVGVAALGRVAGGSSVAASVATAATVACEQARSCGRGRCERSAVGRSEGGEASSGGSIHSRGRTNYLLIKQSCYIFKSFCPTQGCTTPLGV